MPTESIEAQFARMDERMRTILEELAEAKKSRKEQYRHNESMNTLMTSMDNRIQKVEAALANQTPTIEEFITIKHRVEGAGKMGKWVWVALGAVITFLFNSRETWLTWLSKS